MLMLIIYTMNIISYNFLQALLVEGKVWPTRLFINFPPLIQASSSARFCGRLCIRGGHGCAHLTSFELCPKIFYGVEVWGLARPVKEFHLIHLELFLDDFGCVLGVIALLKYKVPAQA